jgi:Bacterial TSP3 repeat/Thrombospondin type 3 repeat
VPQGPLGPVLAPRPVAGYGRSVASCTRLLRQCAKSMAAGVGVLLGLAWIAAPAGAATEIGQLAPTALTGCSQGNTFVQHTEANPPSYRVPPGGGVITRWTLRQGAGAGTAAKLKVLRPEGGTDYRTVGDSAVQTLTPSTVNTFGVGPPGIAVQGGDVLAVRIVTGTVDCAFPGSSGDALHSDTTDAAPGTSTSYSVISEPYRLNLTALVESDRDGDGRGDDSQDFDDDGDGLTDTADNCPLTGSGDTADPDGDGQGNPCDPDDDGDGLSDAAEAELGTNSAAPDTDGDGRRDAVDRCPLASATTADGCPLPAQPDPDDTAAPGVALSGFPARLRRRTLLAQGLRGTARPSEPSSFEVRLLGTVSGARITRAGDVVLAERALPLAAGPRRMTLRVVRRVRRRLARRLRLRLEVRATDAAGNRSLVTRRISVR